MSGDWLGLSVSQQEGTALGCQPALGTWERTIPILPLPKQRQVIGMAVYPCRKVPQEDMVRGVLVLESDRLSFENATAITPL